MPQTKKKKATRTAKKPVSKAKTHKKSASRTACKKGSTITNRERIHLYIVTALGIIAGILLCADAAIMSMV